MHTDVHSIANETETPADEAEAVRISANEQNGQTHLVELPEDAQTSQMAAGTMRIGQAYTRTCYDMETAKDEAETISMCPMESKLPNPLNIGANGCANKTDGSRNHPGTLNMRTHTITPANEAGNISMHPNKPKTRNSPSGAAKQHSHESNSFRDMTNPLSGHRDNHSIGNITGTVANETEIIRTR